MDLRHRISRATQGLFSLTLVLILSLAALGVPTEAQELFTIEEVMSAPFPEGLVSAPQAGVIAWVYNHKGVRNIWAKATPWPQARQITSYRLDDGQAVSGLILTPDGSQIIFVRGGGPNARGEIPNPLSEPEPAERALWVIDLQGGEPRKLGKGGGAALSPHGNTLAVTREGGAIWLLPLLEEGEETKLATIRGGPGALRWSPEGDRLAFISNRGDHSFLGVLAVDSREISYLDPSTALDQSPVWSPDGERIAYIRTVHSRSFLPFTPVREGIPWKIRVVEVGTGEAETVWEAEEGAGSAFHGVSASNQLLWGAQDRIVFPWEGNGWLNLFSVPASGGEATPLTPGEFEVQYVSLAAGGRDVLFSSNQGDIDRQHVGSVSVTGGRARIFTEGSGIEWSPVSADLNGGIAILASGPKTPARTEIIGAGGVRERLLPPDAWESFPQESLVTPQPVVFSGADGMPIHGQLFLPRNHASGGPHPALLFFHGGSRRQMLLGFHHRGYYHNAYAFNQYLASRGFVVLSVNYRSGIGYGMEFREAWNYGAQGASEFNDVLGAGLYLQSRDDVDPTRIGLWGGSYGGYLTALGLARASDLFAAGVDLHGVHDWNPVIKNFVPSYEAEAHPEFAALALRSSPMADLSGWRSPILLIHGDDDRNVPFSESVELAAQLLIRGVEFEELVFPDEVHGFLLHKNWIAAFRAAADFFERKLQPGR